MNLWLTGVGGSGRDGFASGPWTILIFRSLASSVKLSVQLKAVWLDSSLTPRRQRKVLFAGLNRMRNLVPYCYSMKAKALGLDGTVFTAFHPISSQGAVEDST